MSEITRPTPEEMLHVLEVANDLRKAIKVEPLTELPPGIPIDTKRCLLAAAFNSNCTVHWYNKEIGGGSARFSFPKGDERIKALVDWAEGKYRIKRPLSTFAETEIVVLELPEEVIKVGRAFDKRLIPERIAEMYQTDLDRENIAELGEDADV